MIEGAGKHGAASRRRVIALAAIWTVIAAGILLRGRNSGEVPPAQQASAVVALARAQQETHPLTEAAPSIYRRSSTTSSSSGSSGGLGPFISDAECDPNPANPYTVTPKELDLQEQRRCALEVAGSPAGGYLAVCLAVKSQHRDLPEWLDYHRRLGVSHFYLMDDSSDPPLDDLLRSYVQEGLVTHRVLTNYTALELELREATCHIESPAFKQLIAYDLCLHNYGARHQFMAFIDVDEFLVLTDEDTPDLPSLLREFEGHGGLAVNWRMFGSSGHKTHQPNTLFAYSKCNERKNPTNLHIKTIANTAYMTRMNGPHDAFYAPGFYTVTTSGKRVQGPFTTQPYYSRIALHHYAVKSEEDFEERLQRGSVMSDGGADRAFWTQTERMAVETCYSGKKAWLRLYGEGEDSDNK